MQKARWKKATKHIRGYKGNSPDWLVAFCVLAIVHVIWYDLVVPYGIVHVIWLCRVAWCISSASRQQTID